MRALFERFIDEESGQDLVEYALLGALVAVVSVLGLQTLGPTIFGFYDSLGTLFASL
jgi:Flp pilus assembly pilin Flp